MIYYSSCALADSRVDHRHESVRKAIPPLARVTQTISVGNISAKETEFDQTLFSLPLICPDCAQYFFVLLMFEVVILAMCLGVTRIRRHCNFPAINTALGHNLSIWRLVLS